MRPQLELIEKIEQYLAGNLSAADKAEFETQIANDPELGENVRLQQEILKGVTRASLHQQVQQARGRYRRGVNFRKWGLGGLGIIIVALGVFYFIQKNRESDRGENDLIALNELGETQLADADRNIAAQTFLINTAKDTVIETKAGIVLAVPANGFLDKEGITANGTVQLIVKEAVDPAAIMKAGLSTRSGNGWLETGGMFYLSAGKDGTVLQLDPAKGIYAEIPADSLRAGMQLYKGRRTTEGAIDWVNPQPLEHELVAVDIQQLNFYPPLYLDSVQQWGYDSKNKVFTDSLYYSFARLFVASGADSTAAATAIINESINQRPRDTIAKQKTDTSSYDRLFQFDHYTHCGINPAKIKSIWNEQFQNTLLATREFEERLYYIHQSGNPALLDLYVNGLDKNMWELDFMVARVLVGSKDTGLSMPASSLAGRFRSFAARRDGKLKQGSAQYRQLSAYYRATTKAYTDAVAKTQQEFWDRQTKLDAEAGNKQFKHAADSIEQMNQRFVDEFTLNLKDAYRQLGFDSTKVRAPRRKVYTVRVTGTGWWNVDKAVFESTLGRTDLDYTDPETGKKAVIRYRPVSFQVDQPAQYDRLYVYLLPDKLSSFMRLTGKEGVYAEKLNELMNYKLVCIGYRDEQAYFYSQENVQPGNPPSITLTMIGNDELDKALNNLGNAPQVQALLKEKDFIHFEIRDRKRQQHNISLQNLTDKVNRLIFPCYVAIPESPEKDEVNNYINTK